MARAKRAAPAQRVDKLAQTLADALVARCRALPQPDRDREDAALAAVSDATSLQEAWERVLARGIVPAGWLEDSERRFYGISGRCARCGHRERCAHVRCLNDERNESEYAFAPHPTSWWDLLVVVGHIERLVRAERIAFEIEHTISKGPSVMSSPRRAAWTWVIETPASFYFGLARRQQRTVSTAIEIAEKTLGIPLPRGSKTWVLPLYKWLNAKTPTREPELEPLERQIEDTGVISTGQSFGWSELRCTLSPSGEAAHRMPRAVPLNEP